MRRELKVVVMFYVTNLMLIGHKAYPDEKGTESGCRPGTSQPPRGVTRRIPMRRELKADPDGWGWSSSLLVTRRIPMRRELKVRAPGPSMSFPPGSQGVSR